MDAGAVRSSIGAMNALRRHRRWLIACAAAIGLAGGVLFWPIGSGRISALIRQRPGGEATFDDVTLFGAWLSVSPAPCKDGPGAFSMWIKPDWTVQITTPAEGTRVYHIEELRRAAISPREWARSSVVLRGRTADGAGVRMLLRQTQDNIIEPLVYELQTREGDIAYVQTAPPPLINCGHSP